MNKLKGNLAAKIVAIVLLAASCLALCGSVAGIAWLDGMGAYRGSSAENVRTQLIDNELNQMCFELLGRMRVMPVRACYDRNIRFELRDENDAVLAGNLGKDEQPEHTLIQLVETYNGGMYFTDENQPLTDMHRLEWDYTPEEGLVVEADLPEITPAPRPVNEKQDELSAPEGTRVCWMRLYWMADSESVSMNAELRAYQQLFPLSYELIVVAVVSFLLAVLLFVFLMAAAGHHDASGEVRASFVEKIPADLLLAGCLAGMAACAIGINEVFSGNYPVASLTVTAACLLASGLLALLWLMSFAVRLKLGIFLESCLIWRVLRWIWKGLKAVLAFLGQLLRGLPLVGKWIPLYLVLLFVDFVFTVNNRRSAEALAFGFCLKALLLAAAILYLALCFQRLRKGAKAIAAGEEAVVIDEKYMIGDLKDHAEDLTHIRDGLSRAVDERMKSERLRTELITNVSHDIKTPLTSIVNYVDLLSREEPENEKTREYIEVLQRQSARLKKLTDDLVEASKASTGSLPVAPEKLELGVLLDQTAGEYGERLTEKQLELRVTKPEEPVYVWADPRHLWRILDNLMSNVLKYALPGTRVYLDLTREGGKAALSFRNISAQPLNVRAEELTERFVRGDSARSTEGSGLGLAIAASLAKLQGIELALAVDGDLFKVVLRFSEAK